MDAQPWVLYGVITAGLVLAGLWALPPAGALKGWWEKKGCCARRAEEMYLRAVRAFAIQAHGAQTYGSGVPYSFHLLSVENVLLEFGHGDVFERAGAWLHDVLDDTAVTREMLRARFGLLIEGLVAFCTDEPGASRKIRNQATFMRMRGAIASVQMFRGDMTWIHRAIRVKCADRLANIRACVAGMKPSLLKMYQDEHPVFRKTLYIAGVCDGMWDEMHRLLFPGEPTEREFAAAVDAFAARNTPVDETGGAP